MTETLNLDDIKYDPSIYPREKWNTHTIDEYVDVLKKGEEFPPLTLEKDTNRILDGVHRWKAYQKYLELYQEHLAQSTFLENGRWIEPVTDIPIVWSEIPEGIPAKLYAASFSRKHGRRISTADCKAIAREIYETNPDFNTEVLGEYLQVSTSTAHTYIQDLIAKRREERQAIAFRLSLLGWTQEEIGQAVGENQQWASYNLQKFSDLENSVKNLIASGIPLGEVAQRYNWSEQLVWAVALAGKPDIECMDALGIKIQPYDVWNWNDCHDLFGLPYPGRIPGQLIAHILYFFTEPGDVIFDPMAGSGTVPDACLMMGRKCYAYDVNDEIERPDVIVHDLASGWPDRIKKANLVFWDPPYFEKMDDGYKECSISRLSRKDYLTFLGERLAEAKDLVSKGTRLAFLMSDWNDDMGQREGIFIWHYINLIEQAGWTLQRHLQVPLPSQQVHPDIVDKFRKSRRLARLERYLLIGQKV